MDEEVVCSAVLIDVNQQESIESAPLIEMDVSSLLFSSDPTRKRRSSVVNSGHRHSSSSKRKLNGSNNKPTSSQTPTKKTSRIEPSTRMLLQAADEGNLEECQALLRKGTNPLIGDYDQRTVLHIGMYVIFRIINAWEIYYSELTCPPR